MSRRGWVSTILATTLVALFFFTRSDTNSSSLISIPHHYSNPTSPAGWDSCSLELKSLEAFALTDTFRYSRRIIKSQPVDMPERPDLTTVNDPLVHDFDEIKQDHSKIVKLGSCAPALTLDVPAQPKKKVDASAFLFGISTTLERLEDSFEQISHWLPHTKAGLLVLITPHERAAEVMDKWRKLGIDIIIEQSNVDFPRRYFHLVRGLYQRRHGSTTKWLVLMDDDTFFPNLRHVVTHFAKRYDYTKPMYIGPLSENFEQVKKHGIMAFGGGGVFLSIPLAETIAAHHDECLKEDVDVIEGDQMLVHCIYKHSSARLTVDYDLHQMDFGDDVSGFFESGRSSLSLHHWKSWYTVDVPRAARVARACGPDCVLQRWKFTDDMVLSNGYSIAEYRDIGSIDFSAIENTMPEDNYKYLSALGPFREALDPRQDKFSFRMLDTVYEKQGMRQVYVHRDPDHRMDEVVELFWVL
ncbi:MAG: hypothetical protein M1814_005413 [Vezdaea aestivalis]|nr:MAG: hypothetical protein M1814_005413 [Vezdaea aestivalis]